MFFCSIFEKTSYSFSMWFVILFVYVEKRSNSRSQIVLIKFLQSFLLRISSVKVAISAVSYEFGHIYWGNPRYNPHILSSVTQMLSCQYCEIFKNSFFIEYLLLSYFSEILREDRILWTFARIILTFFIFRVPLLCFPS